MVLKVLTFSVPQRQFFFIILLYLFIWVCQTCKEKIAREGALLNFAVAIRVTSITHGDTYCIYTSTQGKRVKNLLSKSTLDFISRVCNCFTGIELVIEGFKFKLKC